MHINAHTLIYYICILNKHIIIAFATILSVLYRSSISLPHYVPPSHSVYPSLPSPQKNSSPFPILSFTAPVIVSCYPFFLDLLLHPNPSHVPFYFPVSIVVPGCNIHIQGFTNMRTIYSRICDVCLLGSGLPHAVYILVQLTPLQISLLFTAG